MSLKLISPLMFYTSFGLSFWSTTCESPLQICLNFLSLIFSVNACLKLAGSHVVQIETIANIWTTFDFELAKEGKALFSILQYVLSYCILIAWHFLLFTYQWRWQVHWEKKNSFDAAIRLSKVFEIVFFMLSVLFMPV